MNRLPRSRLFHLALVLMALTVLCAGTLARAAAHTQMFQLPAFQRTQLPNGLTLLLLEKHQLPLISVAVTLRSGSVADPPGKEGLAFITASLLRKGTISHSSEQVSSDLDFMGMEYDAQVEQDDTLLAADFPKKDLDTALPLLGDVVLHPAFPDEEVKKKIAQEQDGIRSAKDEAEGVIQVYFMKFLYGDHPYGRPAHGDERSLGSITREDVASFYRTHYTPGNTIIAVAGDFDSSSMQSRMAQVFGSWSGKAPS